MWPMLVSADGAHAVGMTDTEASSRPPSLLEDEPPPMTLMRLMTGYWVAQAIHVVAALDVVGAIVGGADTSEEIAARCGADAIGVHRLVRALAGVGLFEHEPPDRWRLGPLGELLRTDQPGSMRPLALMFGGEQYRAWADLVHSVTTGEPAFPQAFGADYYKYLADHPQPGRVFNEAMSGITVQMMFAVTDAYDFSRFGTIADIGGGRGAMLAAILEAAPDARGILFDQPHVVAEAAIASSAIADRCTTVGGDFFVEVPADADGYVLSQSSTTGTTTVPSRSSLAADARWPQLRRCSSSSSSSRRSTRYRTTGHGSTCTCSSCSVALERTRPSSTSSSGAPGSS